MAGTSTDGNALEKSRDKGDKKSGKKRSVFSQLPRLATLVRKKTEETTATASQSGGKWQSSDNVSPSPLGAASSRYMWAKVGNNGAGHLADADASPGHEPGGIYSSPLTLSANSDASSPPWSSRPSSGIDTAITTPGSAVNGKGKRPIRSGVLPDASPEDERFRSWPSDRHPSASRSITWSANTKSAGQKSKDKAAPSEANLIGGDALTRMATFENDTRFASSTPTSSSKYYQRDDVRKSVTPHSEYPKWKLSQRAQVADPETLPTTTKVQSAPLQPSSSKLPVSKEKRVSPSGKNCNASKAKEAIQITTSRAGLKEFGKPKRAVPLPREFKKQPKPVLEPVLEPMKDPGYSDWAEATKEQRAKERTELVAALSSYNISTAQTNRKQPQAQRLPIGPCDETYDQDFTTSADADVEWHDELGFQAAADTLYGISPNGISPRIVPATLPAGVELVEEEEEEALTTSSSCSSASDSASDTEPDSDSSAQNNSTKATRARKWSKSQQQKASATDSAYPSAKQSLKEKLLHPRSGSIDLDLLESKLVKAGRYEKKVPSSLRPSVTPPNAHCGCNGAKLELYRSNEDGKGGKCNGFQSCDVRQTEMS